MSTTKDGCGHDHDEMELDLAADPTLASCCERDQQEFDKAMKLKAVLTVHDPTSGSVRMRQQLFQPPPQASSATAIAMAQQPPSYVDVVDDSDFDDSDDEFGVEAVLAARRKQLEQQFQQAKRDAADGYGVVLDAALSVLVQELQTHPEVPRVALVVDAHAAETAGFVRAMRSEMTVVAQRYVGTKFYVVHAAPTTSTRDDDVMRQLRLTSSPCLAAFRRGECVDSVVLDARSLVTELDVLWEARFLPWLAKCNVLTSERQDSPNGRSGRSGSKKSGAAGDEEEPSGYDCGVEGCRLRFGYEHEHVGTSQDVKDEIAAWRQTPSQRGA